MNKPTEYIKREDALKAAQDSWTGGSAHQKITDIPAADVVPRTENTVEVVRCKCCRWRETEECPFGLFVRDDEYCSDGIRNDVETREERAERHLQHIIDMGKRKDGDARSSHIKKTINPKESASGENEQNWHNCDHMSGGGN